MTGYIVAFGKLFGKKAPEGPQPSMSSSLDLLAHSFGGRWERTTEIRDTVEIVILRIVAGNGDSFSATGATTASATAALEAKAAKMRSL